MSTTLIKNAIIINEGESFTGSVLIDGALIKKIYKDSTDLPKAEKEIDASGMYLVPGVIDDQVHFREPGLIHKGDISSESRAAVAGGVTSFMEMPNTSPQTTTIEALEAKYSRASVVSMANYSFYMGATNDNLEEVLKVDPSKVCGVKVFMGSSTGNMLVDNMETLNHIFKEIPMLITTHCEDETTIKERSEKYRSLYGNDMPFRYHAAIRNDEACYISSSKAVELATKHNSRLHILHLSTKKELSLLNNTIPLTEKRITGEVCVHHLWFDDRDYDLLGSRIKWNPAIKSVTDRDALREGLVNNLLDVVATDHAPHTLQEKQNSYFSAPSGGPLVQHSLPVMLELADQGILSKELVVEKMCHAPAILFRVIKRGYIREGYFADLALVDPNANQTITDDDVLYKCKWTPFNNTKLKHAVARTWVNGHLVFDNGVIDEQKKGSRLLFDY
ncbi:dihydroorotase [Natronoflexus pectinivorans]|uniref:Dihydroorotase n=1 Tax=Natronoflexus pectinivorans TaxID=682526 RepID=A0A4R2GAG5_9BACT|nr:dihydroorotase [Natronoflexus pectinivorans]TCO04937.1 dihydroorotase [Natronoflexus pectinivorans]